MSCVTPASARCEGIDLAAVGESSSGFDWILPKLMQPGSGQQADEKGQGRPAFGGRATLRVRVARCLYRRSDELPELSPRSPCSSPTLPSQTRSRQDNEGLQRASQPTTDPPARPNPAA